MKKIIFISFSLIILLTGCSIGKETNEKLKSKVSIEQTAFTITDSGTEIEATIKNKNSKDIEISGVEITLYNESKEKIGEAQYTKKIKVKKKDHKSIKINMDEKYLNATTIKFKILKIGA